MAIKICGPGVPFSTIGEIIQYHGNKNGFAVSEKITGHGIGKELLMPPFVWHYKFFGASETVMKPGMIFTIEPVFHMHGNMDYRLFEDGQTVHCKGNPSCQWQHTVLITKYGHEVLTQPKNFKRSAATRRKATKS